jgi:hypothetical protein
MCLPSCTKHRKLSYNVVLTPKGMKFSGYGKRLAVLTLRLLLARLHCLPDYLFIRSSLFEGSGCFL